MGMRTIEVEARAAVVADGERAPLAPDGTPVESILIGLAPLPPLPPQPPAPPPTALEGLLVPSSAVLATMAMAWVDPLICSETGRVFSLLEKLRTVCRMDNNRHPLCGSLAGTGMHKCSGGTCHDGFYWNSLVHPGGQNVYSH